MQIELLKNRKTKIIEKLIISHHDNYKLKSLANLNLTHEESMVDLGKLDIKWHQIFTTYDNQQNKLKIMNDAQIDFNHNRKINFILNYFFTFHEGIALRNDSSQKQDIWFINYYFWSFFYIVLKGMVWNKELEIDNEIDEEYAPVFDPFILFVLEGMDYCCASELMNPKEKDELRFIFDMHLKTRPDTLFNELKHIECNDQDINLLIFEKEVLDKNEIENKEHIFWLLKEKAIASYLMNVTNYKIHYYK